MKKSTKKGFTLVELVIVIAVIAILSAILVPTFGNIIDNANRTKAQADTKSAITSWLSDNAGKGLELPETTVFFNDDSDYYFEYTNGNLGEACKLLAQSGTATDTAVLAGSSNFEGWTANPTSGSGWFKLSDGIYYWGTVAA